MRSKSIINVKRRLADELNAGLHKYGAILAESYWKQTKDGFIQQSTPTTSEILDGWFYPFFVRIDAAGRVMINRWFTNIRIEYLTEAGGVNVERIVFKPDLDTEPTPPGFITEQCWQNFREHWAAND
ncbi:MAG: hypothetical protein J6W96_06205 [Alphaproteobacteria bacterium]|nr:hypothetical protein [Alphaproteobacteria bacterium]